MRAISRFPGAVRDVSLWVAAELPAQRVRELIAAAEEPLMESVHILEEYADPERVPSGKKGVLWSLAYRSASGTLTDAEVDQAHESIVSRLLTELPAERR